MSAAAAAKAAELLLWSRKSNTRLDGLPSNLDPPDLEAAYQIQAIVAQSRPSPLAGFKLGLTSPAARRATGAPAPIVGRLAVADIHRSPAAFALPKEHLRAVEAEVIFEVGRDFEPAEAPFSEAAVLANLCGAFIGIEVCDSRFIEQEPFSLPLLIADNSNADLLVLGERLTSWDVASLENRKMTLEREGQPPIVGTTANVMGQPLRAVAWLANWLARQGQSLKHGQLISSGSCTGITEVVPDELVTVRFEDGPSASVKFSL